MEKRQYVMPQIEVYNIRRSRLICSSEIRGAGTYNMRYGGVDTEGVLDQD